MLIVQARIVVTKKMKNEAFNFIIIVKSYQFKAIISSAKLTLLDPPSREPYNAILIPSDAPVSLSHRDEDLFLVKFVFKGKVKNGFFIEAGASDFVDGSNSLWFEMKHNWSGVLVEPNPHDYPKGLGTYFLSKQRTLHNFIGLLPREKPGVLLSA